jgi:hypothetical protein
MIGKIMKAASFKRCVQYVTGKEDAKILASDGVLLTSTQDIIDSFEFQRQLNPRISKPVGHIALSFLPEDKDKLTDETMTQIAMEYMELMGIRDTQFLLVRHFDNGNPHCHLVYNRINNEGKTISDQNDFRRNEQVTKQLKRKYILTFSKGKETTKTERLRGNEKTRYEVYHIVMNTLAQATSWREFTNELKRNDLTMDIVMKKNGSTKIADIQGLRFTKDGKTFKASQIRRGMTYTKMANILKRNAQKEEETKNSYQQQTSQSEKAIQEQRSKQQEHHDESQLHSFSSSIGIPSLGLFDTSNPVYDPEDEAFRRRLQQKKKKKRGQRL